LVLLRAGLSKIYTIRFKLLYLSSHVTEPRTGSLCSILNSSKAFSLRHSIRVGAEA